MARKRRGNPHQNSAASIAIELAPVLIIGGIVYLAYRKWRGLGNGDYGITKPIAKASSARPASRSFYQRAANTILMPTFQKPTQAQVATKAFESAPPVDSTPPKFMAARKVSAPDYKVMEQVDFGIDKAPATATPVPRPVTERPTAGGPSDVKDDAREAAYQTLEKLVADSDTVKTLVDGAIKDAAGSSFKYLSEAEVKDLNDKITPMIGHSAREVAEDYVEFFEKENFPTWLKLLKLAGDYKSGAIEKKLMEKAMPKVVPVVATAVLEARKRQVTEIGAGAVRGFFKLINPERSEK